MPHFGFSQKDAENVAAFLKSISKKAHSNSEIKAKEGDVSAGNRLLNSLGCVVCHRLPTAEKIEALSKPYEGPELIHLSLRRSPGWIDRWLRDPASLNADHRMPVFELSKDERRQLVAALSIVPDDSTPSDDHLTVANVTVPEDVTAIDAGRELVKAANCAGCHTIPGLNSAEAPALAHDSFQRTGKDCLLGRSEPLIRDGRRLPAYSMLIGSRADAIMDYVSSMKHDSPLSASARGKVLLTRNSCVACHDRNSIRGLSSVASSLANSHPKLKGQSQGLIPPPLTAVGDKLTDDYLRRAVAGEQKEHRLPWLHVRMPKFAHSDADRTAMLHHFVTNDRIPDEADAVRQDVLAHVDLSGQSKASSDDLLLGNQLTGAGGFNCVACHKAGPFEPRNVALGTRGSDILSMGQRIRPRFFQRWMKNPIRVVAGIEMPAIKKAMPGVLDESLPKQIGAVWKALSDERFTPPTVTSRFEQVVNVKSGGRPRVIRDVFTIGIDKDREPVARAMAVGFGNGHNILIDLDVMQVRQWTLGEFARQRTEGKSWYWDMPGTVVAEYTDSFPLLRRWNGRTVDRVADESRKSEVLHYRSLPSGVEIFVREWFDDAENKAEVKPAAPHDSVTAWNDDRRPLQSVTLRHRFVSLDAANLDSAESGWKHVVDLIDLPSEFTIETDPAFLLEPAPKAYRRETTIRQPQLSGGRVKGGVETSYITSTASPSPFLPKAKPVLKATSDLVTSTPGFDGQRLPINAAVMPTSMAWLKDGRLVFTSLKGHVWIASDTDSDGLADQTTLFEEGLAAPFGIVVDSNSLIVAHKPEIVRLTDTDNDGRADEREVIAAGWGFNDNYHDWTAGLIRDKEGNLYAGLGSDYSQKNRPKNQDRWRGGVIKIDPSGIVTPLGMSMRYPMGLAMDRDGNLFATDNQGVQNTFNEINHILPGKHYGVPSAHQPTDGLKHEAPALMVPHPWTRSVNSILFLPDDFPVASLQGHGIGCEYDSRFLIRFTTQNVNGTMQGASYRFSLPDQEAGRSNFIGPISSAISPNGEIFIGSIWDSGWQGGQNTGGITRLVPSGDGLPNGIRELTVVKSGFEVEFFQPVDIDAAADTNSWSLQAYTRKWGGGYATPDSGRHAVKVSSVKVSEDGKRVHLSISQLQPGFLYDVSIDGKLAASEKLWPSEAHYSMKVVPQ